MAWPDRTVAPEVATNPMTLADALHFAADTVPVWSHAAVMVLAGLVIGLGHLIGARE